MADEHRVVVTPKPALVSRIVVVAGLALVGCGGSSGDPPQPAPQPAPEVTSPPQDAQPVEQAPPQPAPEQPEPTEVPPQVPPQF